MASLCCRAGQSCCPLHSHPSTGKPGGLSLLPGRAVVLPTALSPQHQEARRPLPAAGQGGRAAHCALTPAPGSQAASPCCRAGWLCCSLHCHSRTGRLGTSLRTQPSPQNWQARDRAHPLASSKPPISPTFPLFSHVKTLLGSWIKISGTVHTLPIPSWRCPAPAPPPKAPSLPLQAGALGQLPGSLFPSPFHMAARLTVFS